MKRLFLVAAGVLAASAGPALAKQCPVGQIFRVSKASCMDRGAALKAGISIAGLHRIARTVEPVVKIKRPDPKKVAPVEEATAADAAAPETAKADPAPRSTEEQTPPSGVALGYSGPSTLPAPSGRSPFGSLSFDGFGLK